MDASQQHAQNLANLKKKGRSFAVPKTDYVKESWETIKHPIRSVERAVDTVKQKYHEREDRIDDQAYKRYKERKKDIDKQANSGKISGSLQSKWTERAKKKYDKESVPIEQRIEKKVEKGAEETWKRATTSPKKKDMWATKVGKHTKNVISYGDTPAGINTLGTPLSHYTAKHNPVGRPRKDGKGRDYGILGGIGVQGFGSGGIGSFETYDDPSTDAGMFRGYQSPFGGGEVKRGRGRPRGSGSEGSNPLFAPISGLGGYQSPFAGMGGNPQSRGRGRPKKDSGGGGFLPSGISGVDSYVSPFAGMGNSNSKVKRGRGRPRKNENNDDGGSIFSLGL